MRKGKIYVVSGPSGVGKGTIVRKLIEDYDNIALSVSATTRSPRTGEVDKVHYFFITKDEFTEIINKDGFIEYAEYCGNYYGTPKAAVYEKLEQGIDVILEIEVQGGIQVMEKFPEACGIFILPPSMAVLEKRLRGRQSEDEETIQKRLKTAKEELSKVSMYDCFVVNGPIEKAVEDVAEIILKNRDQ
ncbi:MAG: guanylate kinase [Clostridia bacterium]|nr:guanylate kinase [Clostridia bacterium]